MAYPTVSPYRQGGAAAGRATSLSMSRATDKVLESRAHDGVQFRAHSGGLAGTRAVGRATTGDDERSAIALGLLGRPPPQTCPSPSLRS